MYLWSHRERDESLSLPLSLFSVSARLSHLIVDDDDNDDGDDDDDSYRNKL